MAKEILIKTKLKSTTQVKEVGEQHFHTNDIGSAELVFRVEDMTKEELSKSDAVIFLNMTDGSFFRKESSIGEVIRVENEFRYTLKENEILHTGLSKVQLSVFSNGKWYSSHLYKFRIVNGLDKKSEIEVEIKDLPSETRKEIAKLKNETNTVITDLSTQFQQVIDETTGKDVISAPELIAARNGKSNLKTRLDDEHAQVTAQLHQTEQELNAQLAQTGKKQENNIINIDALGAKKDDASFDNAPILRNAFDNYDTVIIEGTYYTSSVHVVKPTTIRGNSNLIAFSVQDYVIKFSNSINIENTVRTDGAYKAYHGIVMEGASRSTFNKLQAIRCKLYGILFGSIGNNNTTSINFAKANVCGTKISGEYTLVSPTIIQLTTPITDTKIRDLSYYIVFPNHLDKTVGYIKSISADGLSITLKRGIPSDLPSTGLCDVYAGGGIAILKHGDNNSINIANVDTANNNGAGLECTSQHALYVSSLTSQLDTFGIATWDYCITITIGKVYFEGSKVRDIIAYDYNNLTIVGYPTILGGFGKNNIDLSQNTGGAGRTHFLSEFLVKNSVNTWNNTGPRTLSNKTSGEYYVVNSPFLSHTITLDYVEGLYSHLYTQPIILYYSTANANVSGNITFKKEPSSAISVEGFNEISFPITQGCMAKFELVPYGETSNKMWKIFKTEYSKDQFTVVS